MTVRRPFLMLLALVLPVLSACAATGPSHEEMQDQIPVLEAGQGRIFFYLTEYPVKSAFLKLNGKRVGSLTAMTFFYKDLPAGDYDAKVFRGRAALVPTDSLNLKLSPGEVRYIEVVAVDVGLRMILTDPRDAVHTIAKCKYRQSSSQDEPEKP